MNDYPTLLAVIYWTYLACLFYFVCLNLYYAALFIFASPENRLRMQQQRHEDFRAISRSQHTLPVSVVIPAYNEEQPISDCLHSLVKLDYPQYEIIVVNDGSKDRTLEVLIEEFKLVRTDIFSRRHFETAKIKAVYRSTVYKEFYVIDKANGGKADSLNAGINFSRYPYVCTCDADTIFDPQALLKGMRVILRDPQEVFAVGTLIGINNGCEIEKGEILSFGLPKERLVVFQILEYLRSFLLNRLAWTRLNFMLVVSGAFAIYRRSVLVELGGFSKEFTCEDIEMTFRVHEHMRRNKIPYRILSLPEPTAWTEAPHKAKNLYHQRHRWQRVICETFWRYKRMFLNPRYGTVGMIGMPYYLFGEVLPWIPEVAAVVIIPLGIYLGVFGWLPLFLFIGIYVLTSAFLSLLAIFLQDVGSRSFTMRELRRLILLSFFETLGYRQLLSAARIAGIVGFLRGEKGWQKFVRVERKDLGEQPLPTGLNQAHLPIPANPIGPTEQPAEDSPSRRPKALPKTPITGERRLAIQGVDFAMKQRQPEKAIPEANEKQFEARLREVVTKASRYSAKLARESEDVSSLVQDLGEYVEGIGALRYKLEEDVRRMSELCEKLGQDVGEANTLRKRVDEEVSRMDKLV